MANGNNQLKTSCRRRRPGNPVTGEFPPIVLCGPKARQLFKFCEALNVNHGEVLYTDFYIVEGFDEINKIFFFKRRSEAY